MVPALPESSLTIDAVKRVLSSYSPRRYPGQGKAAAVLLPLFEREGRLHVLLTKRTERLTHHAGQFSFPGGKRDATDADARATALREAKEEIGLDPGAVDIVGELDDCPTFVTNYLITPVVGLIPPDLAFTPNADEIALMLEAPLGDFLAPGALRTEQTTQAGIVYKLYFYTVKGHVVWGATARILTQLFALLAGTDVDELQLPES